MNDRIYNKLKAFMKKSKILVVILFITSISYAQKADDIIGKYRLPNKLDLEIIKKGDKYFGQIIALNGFEDNKKRDIKNPDKSKKNDLLLHKIILKDLEFDEDNKEWINGSMYGPEKGMFFNLKVTKMRKKEIEVVGSKYFFWHTVVWKKL